MLQDNFLPTKLTQFEIKTLRVESESLKGNPLGDAFIRDLPILLPLEKGGYNCVFVLSGFTSNAQKNFNFKSYEKNFIEELDEWTQSGSITPKIYVFIDAWTSWGGSQFINSKGCGDYEDYVVKDVLPQLINHLEKIGYKALDNVLLGGSSGGYGVLHLSSKHPEKFQHCLAIAPDCDFEVSLKPEIYHAFADVEEHGGVKSFLDKLKSYEIKTNQRSFHTVVNALAMAACYSEVDKGGMPILPLEHDGSFNGDLWAKWLSNDPIYFLKDRVSEVKKLKSVFLSVGKFDQFLLQYGARKIKKIFEENKVDFTYEEFRGNHFDIGTRRKKALSLV